MNNYTSITACRLCKSTHLETIIDFGRVPLANSYPISKDANESYYPMTLLKCLSCSHVQLKETVSPEILFSNYSYASSDSPSLVGHFNEYACSLVNRLKLSELDSILEIGSNDGILLKSFAALHLINLYGVEPASNISKRSEGIGATIFNCFFNESTAKDIADKNGKMKVICANNVFAHIADLDSVMSGVVSLLSEDGVFVFENAYLLDTIKGLYFDQCYHEHLQYYGIYPLVQYLNKYNLQIFHIDPVSTQGGSFRIYCKFYNNEALQEDSTLSEYLSEEARYGLYDAHTYLKFSQKIGGLSASFQSFLSEQLFLGKTFSCYGCPAKFALFSKVFGLDAKNIKYVVDDSPLKHGKYSPGKKIPIVNRQQFVDEPTDYCIVSAWNMADSIIVRNKQFTGKWIINLPEFKIK